VPDEEGDIPGEEANEKSHKGKPSLSAVRAKVERAVRARHINYPVLLDPRNSVGGQYNGGELPTTIILDSTGRVRRRFIGERDLSVFQAMLTEAAKPLAAASTHPLLKVYSVRNECEARPIEECESQNLVGSKHWSGLDGI
jgi:hypothetical protein